MAYQETTFFLFHTVMHRHFLNLISQDFWCPHLFVSADITVPVLYNKDAAVKRSQSHSKVNCKYLHPIMNEALRRSLGRGDQIFFSATCPG